MVKSARAFARDGKDINGFFSTIVSNTERQDTILVILDAISNYEYGFSAKSYLNAKDRKNIRFYNYEIEPNDSFEAGLKDGFKSYFNDLLVDRVDDNYPCIAVLPFKNNYLIINKTDSLFSYSRNDYDDYTVFTRYNP